MNVCDDLTKHGAQRRLNLYADRNQCPACGELFNSLGAFDKHRTGDFFSAARRCLSVSEMQASGMVVNERGFWVKAAMTDADRARTRQTRTADAPASIHIDA